MFCKCHRAVIYWSVSENLDILSHPAGPNPNLFLKRNHCFKWQTKCYGPAEIRPSKETISAAKKQCNINTHKKTLILYCNKQTGPGGIVDQLNLTTPMPVHWQCDSPNGPIHFPSHFNCDNFKSQAQYHCGSCRCTCMWVEFSIHFMKYY